MPALWWTVPPVRQASYLVGADPELLSVGLDPLPSSAPAVVQFHPVVGAPFGDQVAVLLDELERAAIAMFPRWLPGAEHLDQPGGLGVAAVRALAAQCAARSRDFSPFLADLAERGLRGSEGDPVDQPRGRRSQLPAEVRAAGLGKVIADAYGRQSAALLIAVPVDLSPADEQTLVATAEWFADHGRFSVWLAGAPLNVVDRVRSVGIRLPTYLTQLLADAEPTADVPVVSAGGPAQPVVPPPTDAADAGPILTYPPLSGVPRPDSPAERALERALARHEWARGRRWNHTFEWHVLGRPYRLDLFWPTEGLVVELDGRDHRGSLKFADDRRRDAQLQVLGHDVLRFTNEQVLSEITIVLLRIEQLLRQRRAAPRDEAICRPPTPSRA